MSGSGLFSNESPLKPHLIQGASGIAGEVGDLRRDVGETIAPLASFTVEEFTDPAASDDDAILEAKDTLSATAHTYAADDLDGAVGAGVMDPPRNIIVTTAGNDTNFVNASHVTIHGKDVNGADLTEAIQILTAGSPGVFTGVKAFARVTGVVVDAQGTHTDGTIKVGFGDTIGLGKKIKVRAGLASLLVEIAGGVKVTDGVVADATASPPNGSYTPDDAPDDSLDYAIYYEYDPTA